MTYTSSGSRTAATSKTERFVIIVNGFQPLTVITKRSILDVTAALDPPLYAIFNCPLFNFSKQVKHWNLNLFSYVVWDRRLNYKGPGIYPQSSRLFQRLLKIIFFSYIYKLTKFGDFMSCSSKDIFKSAPCLMY